MKKPTRITRKLLQALVVRVFDAPDSETGYYGVFCQGQGKWYGAAHGPRGEISVWAETGLAAKRRLYTALLGLTVLRKHGQLSIYKYDEQGNYVAAESVNLR